MRLWVLVVVGALLIGGLPTAAILLASDETTSDHRDERAAHGRAWGHRDHGGPPGQQKAKPWKQGRPPFGDRTLTPAQRERLADLARRRAAALERLATCLDSAKDLGDCPLPRGQLKRLSPRPRQG